MPSAPAGTSSVITEPAPVYASSPTRHRRHERHVHARAHALADRRAVLALAVVVGGDRARAQIGPLAHVRIADVGQVRDLRAGADVGVLDLHERPHLRALAQDRRRDAGRRTARRSRRPRARSRPGRSAGRCSPAPIFVLPRIVVNGSITVSLPISTSTSITVAGGSTMLTPARMCRSWIARCASLRTCASATRSLTPSTRLVSCEPMGRPPPRRSAVRMSSTCGRYSSPCAFSAVKLRQRSPQRVRRRRRRCPCSPL